MKFSFTSASNAVFLGGWQWILALVISEIVISIVYFGWDSWERYEPGPDHRETCWAELQSDYWAYMRWMKKARETYNILLLGDSVVWGQEVDYDETISHYLNEYLGTTHVANMGNDGLFMAGINGIIRYYGDYLDNTKVILQCNPLWMSNPRRDLRGKKKSRYHHPRLIPQFDSRINYYHHLSTRLGYQLEHYFRVFTFIRHLMANYYENKSISSWMMDHPYEFPFATITFEAADVMAEKQGQGIDWKAKQLKRADDPFMNPDDSIQFGLFLDAIERLQEKNTSVFVMIGPYNNHYLTDQSKEKLFSMVERIKESLDERRIPYYDTFTAGLPSNAFSDSCHMLKEGHEILARKMTANQSFISWVQ